MKTGGDAGSIWTAGTDWPLYMCCTLPFLRTGLYSTLCVLYPTTCTCTQDCNVLHLICPLLSSTLTYLYTLYSTFFYCFTLRRNYVYCTVLYCTVSNQSLQRVSSMPQSTLDKSSHQYNLFGLTDNITLETAGIRTVNPDVGR